MFERLSARNGRVEPTIGRDRRHRAVTPSIRQSRAVPVLRKSQRNGPSRVCQIKTASEQRLDRGLEDLVVHINAAPGTVQADVEGGYHSEAIGRESAVPLE